MLVFVTWLRPQHRVVHWGEADRPDFARDWEAEIASIPEFTGSDLHILTGLLLPIWKRLPNDSMTFQAV